MSSSTMPVGPLNEHESAIQLPQRSAAHARTSSGRPLLNCSFQAGTSAAIDSQSKSTMLPFPHLHPGESGAALGHALRPDKILECPVAKCLAVPPLRPPL